MKPAAWTLLATLLLAATAADAQFRGKRFGDQPGGNARQLEYDVKATGLSPVFPQGYRCDPIASPYGSRTRHDGTPRREDRNGGLHGGLDISLVEGTPLLAVAGGTVAAKGEGGLLEGHYLWLRHAPADTGLPVWTYTKYQHLAEPSKLQLGERVGPGQAVGLSGLTGTIGPAYGPQGYPHLHLTLFLGGPEPAGDPDAMPPRDGRIADPLVLYLPAGVDPAKAADLPEAAKRLPVPVALPDGGLLPAASRVAWPTRCTPAAP